MVFKHTTTSSQLDADFRALQAHDAQLQRDCDELTRVKGVVFFFFMSSPSPILIAFLSTARMEKESEEMKADNERHSERIADLERDLVNLRRTRDEENASASNRLTAAQRTKEGLEEELAKLRNDKHGLEMIRDQVYHFAFFFCLFVDLSP